MELIFEYIKNQPEYFAWAFAVVNVLWGLFVYFNKKSHDREIETLKQSLNLDLERRKKVFEMKASSYEAYFTNIDAFQRKHQNDYQEVLTPLLNKFMKDFLFAESTGDTAGSTKATIWFSEEIQKLTINGFQEQQALERQTNALKLTASSEVADLLEELRVSYSNIFNASSQQLNKFVDITINNDQDAAKRIQNDIDQYGSEIKEKTMALRESMRRDLLEI